MKRQRRSALPPLWLSKEDRKALEAVNDTLDAGHLAAAFVRCLRTSMEFTPAYLRQFISEVDSDDGRRRAAGAWTEGTPLTLRLRADARKSLDTLADELGISRSDACRVVIRTGHGKFVKK